MLQTASHTKERITHEAGNQEAWHCICGNEPHNEGFSTCDENGNEIEQLKGGSWSGLYVCERCGRIINKDTLEVLGINPNFTLPS